MRLIVNIPAYNEEEKIAETIHKIPRGFQGIDEVLIQVIDDGSIDKTAEKAREAGADLIVSYKPNRRLAYSFKRAIENSLENGADIMVNIDADGQFDANEIPKLLEPILEGRADMVIGNRFGETKAENIPWIRKTLNKFAAGIIGFFLGHKTNDLTCGFRAHNRETMLRLNLVNTHFTYTQETIIDAIGKDLKLVWVPISVTYFDDRKAKITKSIWKFVGNSAKIILKAIRDVRPLKFFGWPGLFFIFLGLIGIIFFAVNYFQDFKITPYRNYIIFSSISIFLGIQLTIFALIADMIKSNRRIEEEIMYQLKKEKYKK
ncbi:MAG TPA: glycosyltransferase family 2 protein [Candidatus Moranbacteria bacterium]|nr:glycosyltransferase family 2 protein [Candidatus Moranbacteria bacterium]HRZ33882.1 glycosyltransferase family 2 protein [Candidatus Moranbacteria bacterium]